MFSKRCKAMAGTNCCLKGVACLIYHHRRPTAMVAALALSAYRDGGGSAVSTAAGLQFLIVRTHRILGLC